VTAVDLFCGCGGLSAGLIDAGFEVVLGVDAWSESLAVYARNLGVPTFRADLVRIPALPPADLIVGGPPCQDFSSAGNRSEGERAGLTVMFAETVAHYLPQRFLYENVVDASRSNAYRTARELLKRAGYGLTPVILDASYYGVPQRRRRLFLVGHLGCGDDTFRDSLVAGAADQPLTVREHCQSHLAVEHYYVCARYPGSRAIWGIDEPAPTFRTSSNSPLPPGYRSHPRDSTKELSGVRALTLREASLVQTFPTDWDWCDTRLSDGWVMLANSVPPRMGYHLGRVLLAIGG